MNSVFKEICWKGVLVFFDDILVYSSTMVEHLKLLEEVFRQNKLFVGEPNFIKEIHYLWNWGIYWYKQGRGHDSLARTSQCQRTPRVAGVITGGFGVWSYQQAFNWVVKERCGEEARKAFLKLKSSMVWWCLWTLTGRAARKSWDRLEALKFMFFKKIIAILTYIRSRSPWRNAEWTSSW